MKKIFVFGALLLMGLGQVRAGRTQDVFRALLDSTQEISQDFRGTSKKKKKKFLKRLIRELIITTLHFALDAVAGSKRQLREDLGTVLEAEGKVVSVDLHDFSDLFDELFMYYSEKLEDLQARFEMKVLGEGEVDDEACELCARVAIATVDKVDLVDARVNWPAIWCFVKIIADIGELVLDQETKEQRDNFVKKVVVLVKDFRDFLAGDQLLESFEKLTSFLTRVREVGSDEEMQKIVEQMVASSKDGVVFIRELFSSVNLYLQDKLAAILSDLYNRLSQETLNVQTD